MTAIRFTVLLVPMLALAFAAIAAPQPSAVPTRWEFQVQPGHLKSYVARVPGEGRRAFAYTTMLITNNTGKDRYLTPSFELANDEGDILRSGRNVPPAVVQQMLASLGNPLLMDETTIQRSPLLQGPEHAREVLIVWPLDDLDIDELTIYAAGLSGENKTIQLPNSDKTVVLRKTLMLRHAVPGEILPGSVQPIERVAEQWIMR